MESILKITAGVLLAGVVAVERAVRRALLDELSVTSSSAARSNRRAL